LSELAENIWNHIQEGDLKSFEIIYLQFYKPLCLFSFHITKNHELSEELVNDLFLKLWTNRKYIFIKGSVKSYLFQAIHNLSLNLVKGLSTNKVNIHTKVTESHWRFIEETYVVNDFLLENIIAEEIGTKINQVITGLPEQCRDVFILSRFKGKTNQEISNQLNIAENTVRVYIFKALSKIKDVLENF
jgi:RNA polymerase sigma-70 factor, ECF subfamily